MTLRESTTTKLDESQSGDSPRVHKLKVPHRSPFGALLSRTLPKYSGPYHVGVCDIEAPVIQQTFGTFRHKSMPKEAGSAGLTMDTVLFSLFYPVETPLQPGRPVVWFPNMRQTIDGFLKMAKRTPNRWYRMIAYPMAAAAVAGTTFPATKDAALLAPPDPSKKWPLMIFSHGVGCSRLMYSVFCGEMASRGYVVACLEHRDGTSPSSKITAQDGTPKYLDWLQWSDLEWPGLAEQPTDDYTLRQEQIKMRCAEIKEVINVVDKLSQGDIVMKENIIAPAFDWELWKNVDASRPVLSGHSLGGSAALASDAHSGTPYSAVVAFDPAVQRLTPWKSTLPSPLLVINSEEFTVGKEFAIFTEQIAHTATAEKSPMVFAIPGATHPSFSDVFLILPEYVNKLTGLRVDADKVLSLTVAATEDFLAGHSERIVQRAKKYVLPAMSKGEVWDGKPRRPVGKAGEIIEIAI